MVASDYKVRVGRQEFNTKCSFDAAGGFEDLLITRTPTLALTRTLLITRALARTLTLTLG